MVDNKLFSVYKGKKVLVTGHTGFKGSWLSIWLHKLGAKVIGVALDPISPKSNYSLSGIKNLITDYRVDIRNKEEIFKVVETEKPEIVFHMAAQPLVLDSYKEPVYTIETNVNGTVNVLEAIRHSESVTTGIFITTDKVYDNKEWIWPYREDEALGGYDPYSSSKGAAEILIASYRNSFFNPDQFEIHKKSIASVRAGNVFGGGDWSENRIIPDCIRAIENDQPIEVRKPNAVRPWQHVLDPLGGYLLLGNKMINDPKKYCEAYNFGPNSESMVNVKSLVEQIIFYFGKGIYKDISINNSTEHEATMLMLDINKAKHVLNWNPMLSLDESIRLTVDWYKNYSNSNVLELCQNQIEFYEQKILLW